METTEKLCRYYTDLSDRDIARILGLAENLDLMADVSNADIFIDCLADGEKAVVVAQGKPKSGETVYEKSVIGQFASPQNEPAVFSAFINGASMTDIKAVTQEGRTVRQNVAPVFGENKTVIAALIREKDITRELRKEQKFEELAREHEMTVTPGLTPKEDESWSVTLREMHHRVKNDLQLISSALGLQARTLKNEDDKRIFLENVQRIRAMSVIQDLVSIVPGRNAGLVSGRLFEKLCECYRELIPPESNIIIETKIDDAVLTPHAASAVTTVVSELVINAIKYAFPAGRGGKISLVFSRGILYHSITVSDNGIGFDPSVISGGSVGYSIIRATVEDKLGGKLRIQSGPEGSRISFDFK